MEKGIKTVNRIGMFNVYKGVLMFIILLGHSITTYFHYWEYDILSNPLIMALGLFGKIFIYGIAPSFFMLCGYGVRKMPVLNTARHQAKYFLKPYFLVAAVTVILILAKTIVAGGSIGESLRYYGLPYLLAYCPGERPFLGVEMSSIGPIWFFVTFFFSTILLNVVLKEDRMWIQIALLVMVAAIGVTLRYVTLPFCFQQTLICTGYMYVGWLMKKKKLLAEKIPLYFLILSLVFILGISLKGNVEVSQNVWEQGLTDLVASYFAGFLLLLVGYQAGRFRGRVASWLAWMGQNALYICCIHTVAYTILPWDQLAAVFAEQKILGACLEMLIHFIIAVGGTMLLNAYLRKRRK